MCINNFSINNLLKKCVNNIFCPFVAFLSTTDLMEYVDRCVLSIRWRFAAEGRDIKRTGCKKTLWRLLLSGEFKLRREKKSL